MAIERSNRPVAAARIIRLARALLDASSLCAIATVAPRGRAHVNTAYFAWTRVFEIVWVSEPRATHSRNVRASGSAAIAIYDSTQTWGNPDRGIQLFGRAREVDPQRVADAAEVYANRFEEATRLDLSAYRFYVFTPQRVKLFDERELGGGTFVTARVAHDGAVTWERTEIYSSAA